MLAWATFATPFHNDKLTMNDQKIFDTILLARNGTTLESFANKFIESFLDFGRSLFQGSQTEAPIRSTGFQIYVNGALCIEAKAHGISVTLIPDHVWQIDAIARKSLLARVRFVMPSTPTTIGKTLLTVYIDTIGNVSFDTATNWSHALQNPPGEVAELAATRLLKAIHDEMAVVGG